MQNLKILRPDDEEEVEEEEELRPARLHREGAAGRGRSTQITLKTCRQGEVEREEGERGSKGGGSGEEQQQLGEC